MRRVYLDFMAWVDLARAAEGNAKSPAHSDALAIARYGVEHNMLEFPLSSIHYMELLQQSDASRREPVGRLMVELSNVRTMAGPHRVTDEEIDRALRSRFGRPASVRSRPVFGYGMGHAFGIDAYRYKAPGDMPLTDELRRFIEDMGSEFVERAVLAGPSKLFDVGDPPGTNRGRELSAEHADVERRVGELMRSEGYTGERLHDAWIARGIVEALDYIIAALDNAGIPWSALTAGGKDALTDFFMDIPVLSTFWELRFLTHQNPQHKWKGNDLRDLTFLSVAAVHCDVLVTERHWQHMLRRTGRPKRYGTAVERDVGQISKHLLPVE